MPKRTCSIDGCNENHLARGYCGPHYRQYVPKKPRPNRPCAVEGCPRTYAQRGWCWSHYERWRKHGDPLAGGSYVGDDKARFWAKVDKQSDCWVWTGAIKPNGYGTFGAGKKTCYAHRWAYEHVVGSIPDGMHIDHLCRNRACVNPAHLEPVSSAVNVNRGHHFRRHVSGEDWLRNPWSKRITAFCVIAIRQSAESNSVLAQRYGVTQSNIEHIKAHRSWKWVP